MGNEKEQFISLKKVAEISGYSPDYLGYLIRTKKIKGKKIYNNISWQTTLEEIVKYSKKIKKNLNIQTSYFSKKKCISLKKAAKVSGYSSDYLGDLIRKGKIEGKKIHSGVSWLTSEEAVEKYKERKICIQDQGEINSNFSPYLNLIIPQRGNKIFGFGWRLTLATFVILFLITGSTPIKFLQSSIGTIFAEEEKVINFYSVVSTGDWQNPENVQSLPEVESLGTIDSFSEANSAVYEGGALVLVAENFQPNFDINLDEKQIESAKIKISFSLTEKEPDILIERQETSDQQQETSDGEIGFWNKVKNFFRALVIRTVNLVKASLIKIVSIAEAEGEMSEGEIGQETGEGKEAERTEVAEEIVEQDTENETQDTNGEYIEEEQTEEERTKESVEEEEEQEEVKEQEEEEKEEESTTEEKSTATDEDISISEISEEDNLPNVDTKIIIWYSLNDQGWQELDTIISSPLSNALNGGYFEYDVSFLEDWDDVRNLKIKFGGVIGGETNIIVYLDSVWVEVNYQQEEVNDQQQEIREEGTGEEVGMEETTRIEATTSDEEIIEEELEEEIEEEEEEKKEEFEEQEEQEKEKGIEKLSKKDSFRADEKPGFTFKYKKVYDKFLALNEKTDTTFNLTTTTQDIITTTTAATTTAATTTATAITIASTTTTTIITTTTTTTTITTSTSITNATSSRDLYSTESDDSTATSATSTTATTSCPCSSTTLDNNSSIDSTSTDSISTTSFENQILGTLISEPVKNLWKDIKISLKIKKPRGNIENVDCDIFFGESGEFSIKLDRPSQLQPGLYKLIITIEDNSTGLLEVQEFEQDFKWGVLAINTNKSIYLPNEIAYLQMAVLKDNGHTVCDANLELRIKNQESEIETVLSTQDETIQYSDQCGPDNVTDVPDYFAYYQVNEPDTYQMKLTNLDTDYEIEDSFEVRNYVPFDVERIGPTRIYPLADYEMSLKIKVNEDFSGEIIESVPESFEIINPLINTDTESNNANNFSVDSSNINGTSWVIWDVNWKTGEEYELSYQFDAPDISPYLYLLGPLVVGNFEEIRQWQIASDADGSGTCVVDPTAANAGATSKTFDFTYTATETSGLDSGGISITVPDGWSEPQGVSTVAGYTTATSTGIIADILTPLDSATGWDSSGHMTISADGGDKQEGSYSISNSITASAQADEKWYFNEGSAKDFGSATKMIFWIKSSVNTNAGDLQFEVDDSADLASPLDTVNIQALSAGVWTEVTVSLGGTRSSVSSYGIKYTVDIGAATVKIDDIRAMFDDAESITNWAENGKSMTLSLEGTTKKQGTYSILCAFASANKTGKYYWSNATAISFGSYTKVSFWIYSTDYQIPAGDLKWEVDDTEALASPLDSLSLPLLDQNTWYKVQVNLGGVRTSVKSYGINQSADEGSHNEYIDAMAVQVNAAESATGWAKTGSMTLSTDNTTYHENSASLKNVVIATAAAGDKWWYNLGATDDWSGYTKAGFWIRSTVNTSAGDIQFEYDDNTDLASPIASLNIGALTANEWSYQNLTLSGIRTTINSYGFKYNTDIGATTINADDILLGPGSPTFSGSGPWDIGIRILALANTETITVTYGDNAAGGGGVTVSSTGGDHTFTTKSRISDSGTLTNIATHPVITVISINISGNVYINEGQTTTSETTIVALAVNNNKTATTSISNGSYILNPGGITASDIITVYWDTDNSNKAVTVSKGATSSISNFHLYKDRVIVRHEGTSSLTIADMNKYDSGQDTDILFTAATGTPNTLSVNAEAELYIWPSKEFAPGGNVTTTPSGSEDSWDGSLKITDGATFTATDTESHSIGGSWFASSTAIFTAASSTVTFTATTTGKTITTAGNSFYNLTFNGSDGGWTFQDVATTTATTTISKGTLSQGANNFITRSLTIVSNATFTKATGGGVFIFEGSGEGYFEDGNETKNNLGNVQIGNSPASTNLKSDFVADSLIVNNGDIFRTKGYEVDITNYITIHGTYNCTATGGEGDETITTLGTNWTVDSGATFTAANSTTTFNGASDSTLNPGGTDTDHDFYHLTFEKTSTATTTLATSTKVSGDLIIGSSSILDASSSNYNINVAGSWTNSGTFIAQQGTVTFDGSSSGKTIDPGSSSFYNLTFDGTGGEWQLQTNNLDTDNDLNITDGALNASSQNIALAGSLDIASGGVFTKGTGTTTFDGSGTNTWTDNNTTSTKQDMGKVVINGSSGKTINLGSTVEATKLTIEADNTLGAGGYTLIITGSGTGTSRPFLVNTGGVFNEATSTVEFIGTATTDVESEIYYNLTLNQSGTTFQLYNNTTTTNNINIATGTLDVTTNHYDLWIGGDWTNTGTFTCQQGTVTFNATSTGKTITTGGTSHPFYDLIFDGSGGGWIFASDDHDVDNDFTITQGTVTSTSGTLLVGGSWLNSAGTFNATSGTVTFDAGSNGKTIDPGSSPFNIITFNNSNGGWTITANATSTNNWNVNNAQSFTAASSITIEVKGNYIISDSIPAVTTWNLNSTLYLNSESAYTVGSKNQSAEAEIYATLKIGNSTDIRMWNSTSSNYTIDSSGSLYSQDHNYKNGKLQIWGDYHTTSTDYWNYADDFDGAGSADRQCQVTINSTTSITIDSGETLEIKGGEASSSDITIINASALWDLNNNGTATIQEATINYLNPATGTITVLNTTLNNEDAPDAGATLNVDWYLGGHVVNVASTSINVANATTTISSTSTLDNTIWKWSGSGWGSALTSQTILTDASGLFPQPGTNGAIRIREYQKTGTSTGEWLSGWDQRIKFTIDHTKIDDDLLYFPVTVFLTSTQGEEVFTEFDADTDYLKVAFTEADGTTQLYAEKELFDDSEQKGIYHTSKTGWAISSSTDTDFYMYYDNDHVDNTTYIGAIDTTAGGNVWDNDFKAVYHMVDDTASTTKDSTSNNNNGIKKGAGEPTATSSGAINGAQDFDGTDDYISLPASNLFISGTSGTLEAFVKTEAGYNSGARILTIHRGSEAASGFNIVINSSTWASYAHDGLSGVYLSSGISVDTSEHYIVATDNGTTHRIYVDGVDKNNQEKSIIAGTHTASIGHFDDITQQYAWKGLIDEARISDIARTPAWVKASYNSGNDSLLTYGGDTTYYKYNLNITANGFSNYDYNGLENRYYIISVSSTESTSTVDKCISENWQRDDIDANNAEQSLNESPTTGTWYAGMSSDLEFGVNSFSVSIGPLDSSNNLTATATTITYVTTTAGYLIQAYDSAENNGQLTTSTYFIIRWPYDNDNPHVWGSGQYGFGYTTNDNVLTGTTTDRFNNSTNYAGFTNLQEPVADRPSDGTWWQGEEDTITYKVSVSVTQHIEEYNTTITYVCTAQY